MLLDKNIRSIECTHECGGISPKYVLLHLQQAKYYHHRLGGVERNIDLTVRLTSCAKFLAPMNLTLLLC